MNRFARFAVALVSGLVPMMFMTAFPAAAADNPDAASTNSTITTPLVPNVESVDILKQNQAERTRDQPGNLAPTYRIVKEGRENYSSLPAREAGVLIQPKVRFPGQARATTAGEAWRNYRNGPLSQIGGWLLGAALLAIVIVYLVFGTRKLKGEKTGRLIERFTPVERIAHWTTAISFVLLALTGLTMLFGRYVVLPLFGPTLFGWFSYICKNVHNFVGPLFTAALIAVFLIFLRDNFPEKNDWKWLVRMGGLFGGEDIRIGRFNAGEKLWFWGGVVLLGLFVSSSGFVLNMLVPGMDYTRGNMQVANVVHVVSAVLFICIGLGHIYMGTLAQEGAYTAMAEGYVDDEWAKEHHGLWYDDIQNGKIPRVRSEEGAGDLKSRPLPAKG
ncbi:MAG: formate dehydrogenase subunit gamma [Burkholderiaceae bacterium]